MGNVCGVQVTDRCVGRTRVKEKLVRRKFDIPLRWVDDALCALFECILKLCEVFVSIRFSKIRIVATNLPKELCRRALL